MTADQMQRLEEAVQQTHEQLLTIATDLNKLVDYMLALERALDALKRQTDAQTWRRTQ